jgi:hypothetical protein
MEEPVNILGRNMKRSARCDRVYVATWRYGPDMDVTRRVENRLNP